jgi:hypothetical protein
MRSRVELLLIIHNLSQYRATKKISLLFAKNLLSMNIAIKISSLGQNNPRKIYMQSVSKQNPYPFLMKLK